MLGKFKQVGNDVKKSMGDLKAHTEIEAEYLKSKSKQSAFDHSEDVNYRIKVATDINLAYEELLSCVVDWVDKYQEVINSEVKAAERFKARLSQTHLPTTILRHASKFGDYQAEIHQLRQTQLGFVLEYIQLPVKKIISDQQFFKPKLDALNKSFVELKYWKTKLNHVKQHTEAQIVYDTNVKQFTEFVDNLRQLAEKDYPQKLAVFQEAQEEFLSGAALVSTFEVSPPQPPPKPIKHDLAPPSSTIEIAKSRAGSLGGDENTRIGNGGLLSSTESFERLDL